MKAASTSAGAIVFGSDSSRNSAGIFIAARANDFLTIESPADWGLPKLQIRPESQRDFFATELPLRVTFKIDNNNLVTGLVVYPPRGQKAVPANKLAAEK